MQFLKKKQGGQLMNPNFHVMLNLAVMLNVTAQEIKKPIH